MYVCVYKYIYAYLCVCIYTYMLARWCARSGIVTSGGRNMDLYYMYYYYYYHYYHV